MELTEDSGSGPGVMKLQYHRVFPYGVCGALIFLCVCCVFLDSAAAEISCSSGECTLSRLPQYSDTPTLEEVPSRVLGWLQLQWSDRSRFSDTLTGAAVQSPDATTHHVILKRREGDMHFYSFTSLSDAEEAAQVIDSACAAHSNVYLRVDAAWWDEVLLFIIICTLLGVITMVPAAERITIGTMEEPRVVVVVRQTLLGLAARQCGLPDPSGHLIRPVVAMAWANDVRVQETELTHSEWKPDTNDVEKEARVKVPLYGVRLCISGGTGSESSAVNLRCGDTLRNRAKNHAHFMQITQALKPASAEPDTFLESVTRKRALCVVCLTQPVATAFAPCGHACCCAECGLRSQQRGCPLCAESILVRLQEGQQAEVGESPSSITIQG